MRAKTSSDAPDGLVIAPDALLGRAVLQGRGNRVEIGSQSRALPFVPAGAAPETGAGPALAIHGSENRVEVAAGCTLGLNLTVRGDRNRIVIGENCSLNGFITVQTSDACLCIGAGTTMVNGSLQLHEPGTIRIGRDCMIANQVYVSLSDIHPIYDLETGERLNPAASVDIGDHVWLGLRCMVMKGSRIGSGSVIGAGAIVTDEVPCDAIAAGAPARVIRTGVVWRRDLAESFVP